jgi:hypothetical protein
MSDRKGNRSEVEYLLDCKDLTFRDNLRDVLARLIDRYGVGYDRIKTISNISVGLNDDLDI